MDGREARFRANQSQMKSAAVVIAEMLEKLEGPCSNLALEEANLIISALEKEGYQIMGPGEDFSQPFVGQTEPR